LKVAGVEKTQKRGQKIGNRKPLRRGKVGQIKTPLFCKEGKTDKATPQRKEELMRLGGKKKDTGWRWQLNSGTGPGEAPKRDSAPRLVARGGSGEYHRVRDREGKKMIQVLSPPKKTARKGGSYSRRN